MSLIAQERDATTGHSEAFDREEMILGATYFFGGQKSDGSFSNELWATNGFGIFIQINAPGAPSARRDHVSYVKDDKLYIQGGIDKNGNCLNDWWVFDIIENTWTLLNSNVSSTCASQKTAIKIHNKVYTSGGNSSNGTTLSDFGVFDLNNISSGYTAKTSMIEPLAGSAGFKKDGNVYLYGGKNNDWDAATPGKQPSYSSNTWKYDVINNFWSMIATNQTKSENESQSDIIELTEMAYTQDTLENFFYVFGGKTYNYETNTEIYSNEIYKLDLNTFSWTKYTTTLPYGLADFTASYIHGTNADTDTIILLGGQKASGTISTNLFKFIPTTGELITIPLTTSIKEYNLNSKISLYPNPAKDLLYIKHADKNTIVTIYNIAGKEIITTKPHNEIININKLAKGVYTIRIQSENTEITDTFIKQ